MNYLIETIGCQMNVCDSDALGGVLLSYGAVKVNSLADCDAVILNTCAVRAQAEQKAFSFLGRAEEFKKEKKRGLKIVVVGCMAERLGTKIKKRFCGVDLVIGAKDIDNAALKILNLCGMDKNERNEMRGEKSEITRFITIMRGCDNYCSYCIVPMVRGTEISLDYNHILKECALMAENGAKEIMLLGQNVNSYNFGDVNFAALVKKVSEIDGIERIRFMTNHPKDLNDELIEVMASEPKVCSHIHLPMQSASDKILKAMNRKYTYAHYLNLVEKLRKKIPDISITTDMIVGFPQEREEDFQASLQAVKDIRFGGLYVFRYSPRPHTKAADMPDDVPLEEKKRRHAAILEESNKISAEIVSGYVGSVREVLTEKYENGVLEARTRSGRKVFVKGCEKDFGKNINVLIKEAKINSLFGDIDHEKA
ncbi:MAG: tRNA (N6-isopentenyl adenosine(37)-C2)-methylthiotransferase MiaB [Endomicrobium sp.]|jgi:tRNA-2-methylthio-N6-dimethylallyladenosine synthase|nr:tRNA (N6-isopentenyl adenosine(37)-C2)-methylthiotransferase MiaB [Endomicrobium sp.]